MPIKPGKCPPGGCPPFTEKDCIEVFKVYDQCVAEELLGGCVIAEDFCTAPIPPDATVTCEVVPGGTRCFFVGFGPFNPPFYRPVRVQNTVQVNVTVTDAAGVVICPTFPVTLQGLTQVLMWAPNGTFVQCQVLAVGDCEAEVTTDPATGKQLICCRVKVCKEIQVKALVKLLVPSYGFCELEPCTPLPQPEFPCPPENIYPPQRCQEPPVFTLQDALGVGISGVAVSLIRKTDSSTVTITKTTDATGTAVFSEVGGFAGSLDDIYFVDPVGNVPKSFHIPTVFTDDQGDLHDSTTACVILLKRRLVNANLFDVYIDGYKLAEALDP